MTTSKNLRSNLFVGLNRNKVRKTLSVIRPESKTLVRTVNKSAAILKGLKSFILAFILLLVMLVPSQLENARMTPQILSERQRECFVQALWHEARGETEEGLRAVATVILNRVELDSKTKPATICSVVAKKKQFSYWHLVKYHAPKPKLTEIDTLLRIHKLATEVQQGTFVKNLDNNVIYYHTLQVNPQWSTKMKTVVIIGKHKFLKEKV